MTTPALLFTGGTSRRMGAPKAEIVWRGERLADRAARVLATVCHPVIEVGPGYTQLAAVLEEPRGGGPLAALVAGHDELARRSLGRVPVVVLGVDLPFVGPDVIRLLADWPGTGTVVPEASGHLQVLCARYGPDALALAAQTFAQGRRSLVGLVEQVRAEIVPEARLFPVVAAGDGVPPTFADVDTPGDVARWLNDGDG